MYIRVHASFSVLQHVFDLISSHVHANCSLSQFQKCIPVLMRLRLNLPEQDLAYQLTNSKRTVSHTFKTVIAVTFDRMYSLIMWPETDSL